MVDTLFRVAVKRPVVADIITSWITGFGTTEYSLTSTSEPIYRLWDTSQSYASKIYPGRKAWGLIKYMGALSFDGVHIIGANHIQANTEYGFDSFALEDISDIAYFVCATIDGDKFFVACKVEYCY